MDRSELERQKAAEMRERSRDILALTRNSNAGDQSDSHWSVDEVDEVDDKVVCHPDETYGMTEEILEDPPKPQGAILLSATQVLNLTRRIGDEVLKMEELVPNNSIVIPNMVPPTSPNGGEDIVMVQQLPRSLLSESSDGLLPPTGLNNVDMMDEIMGGTYPAPGDEMVSSTATVSVPGSTTTAEVARNGKNSTNRSPKGKYDLHHLDSEEEKQEVTEIANFDKRDASTMGRDRHAQRPRHSDSEEEEEETEDPTPGAFSNEQGNLVRRVKGHITASLVDNGQTSSLSLTENEESAVVGLGDTSSIILAELVPDEKDAANRLDAEVTERVEIELSKKRELQVMAQVVDDSSICGLSRNWFFLVVIVLPLIIVGVVVGVVVASGGRDGDPPTMAPTASPTTMTPTASPSTSMTPTASPTTISKFTKLLNIIGAVTSDIELLQDRTTPQGDALDWLANVDTWEVDINSVPSQVFVARYVLALLFYSTKGRVWEISDNIFLPTSVCAWSIDGSPVVGCNEDESVVSLSLSKLKHEEVDSFILFV
jgi:hypothetical protein